MRLYLVGYMGCGKSSIGRKIARRTGMAFVDTDAVVEQAEQASVADIVNYAGEEYFRRSERKALDDTVRQSDVVVSTGGGLPVWSDNMARIRLLGKSVYIRRTPEQILSRLSPYGRFKRPKFRGLTDAELLEFMRGNMAEREPFYSQADLTVDGAGLSYDEITDAVVAFLNE